VDVDTLVSWLPWLAVFVVAFVGYLFAPRAVQRMARQAAEELARHQAAEEAQGKPAQPAERVSLPLVERPGVGRCATCNHFDLSAGQAALEANPAFQAASAVLAPWQMARERKVKPNPEYVAVEAQLREAQAAGDVERSRELHDRLLTLDPGEVLPDEEQVEREMLALDWKKLGGCGLHRELRFATDACSDYVTEV
jgi:hypothetical protein